MSERSKASVLRDVAMTAQSRALPLRRAAPEPKPMAARPVPAFTASSVASQVAPPTRDEPHARALAEELQAARETGLREGLAEAQRRLDEAMRAATEQLQRQTEALQAQMQSEHDASIARVDQTLQGLTRAWAQRVDALESDAIELAFAAVCRLMGEARADRAAIAALIEQGIAQLRGGAALRVRVHPDDLAALQGDALMARHPAIQWLADTSVSAGGCLLDTEHGTLDARLDRQLARLASLWATPAPARNQEA